MHETSVTKGILSHGDYEAFQQFLQQACGIVLGAGKEYLVSSRLGGLMRHYDIATVGELLNQLHHGRNPSLKTGIIDAMTTNETFWFRDMAHFNLLQQRILPELCDRSASRIRIWSAACSSGQARSFDQEGRAGFVHAFFVAGAKQVVVSLWDVDDAATSLLMQAFHRELARGADAAAAMRVAQGVVRNDARFRHPAYWAGWQVWGPSDPR